MIAPNKKTPEPEPQQKFDVSEENVARLYAALKDASEHLDFCGYGDQYERECAEEDGLRDKIGEALEKAHIHA